MADGPKRSIAKAFSWRALATLTTILIVYTFTGDFAISLGAGAVEVASKMLLYYGHERVWTNIRWGQRPMSDIEPGSVGASQESTVTTGAGAVAVVADHGSTNNGYENTETGGCEMGLVQASDLKGMLDDEELMADIADAVVETPGVLEALAEDIAGQLEEEMENAPALRKRIIGAALASPEFKKTLAAKLVSEIDDD